VPLPPELGPITSDPADGVVAVGNPVDFAAAFTDPNAGGGPFSAAWDWGDSSNTFQNNVPNPVEASHAYAQAGLYAVELTLTDDSSGLSDEGTYEFVVVYDPSDGFVTGAGWINSPAGAFCPAPSLTGKANFAFVSKYTTGKQVPTGNTQFQFNAAGLNLSSEEYNWLVVTGGHSAIFKGVGTINGQLASTGEPYKFIVWAGDDEPDTFRVRIWYEDSSNNEFVLYDNVDLLCDGVDDGGPNQPISAGSIVVHTGKGK
jgi:PKD repeat protein